MTARQQHGFLYEANVLSRCLKTRYITRWDLPAEIKRNGIPASIKCVAEGNSIMFGDVLRQYDVGVDFEIVLGVYEVGKTGRKTIIFEIMVEVPLSKWRCLWGNLERDALLSFVDFVKADEYNNLTGDELDCFRKEVQQKKRELLTDYSGKISIYPKIDHKGQRRVQCGLSFNVFMKEFNIHYIPTKNSDLFGGIVLHTIDLGE